MRPYIDGVHIIRHSSGMTGLQVKQVVWLIRCFLNVPSAKGNDDMSMLPYAECPSFAEP
jgi:hypothetical protein